MLRFLFDCLMPILVYRQNNRLRDYIERYIERLVAWRTRGMCMKELRCYVAESHGGIPGDWRHDHYTYGRLMKESLTVPLTEARVLWDKALDEKCDLSECPICYLPAKSLFSPMSEEELEAIRRVD